jgi:hypothetical protein
MAVRLAFGCECRVGKDTACEYLERKLGGVTYRFAEGVYAIGEFIQTYLGRERKKDPALLQFIGMGLRNVYGEDVWVERLERKIDAANPFENIYIADMRFPNEADMLRRKGFVTVRVVRNNRPIDRDPNHPSEISLVNYPFDEVVINDGTLEEFYQKIDKIVAKYASRR